MRVLLLGSDARTHAVAWKLYQSEYIRKLYAYPGNAGIFKFCNSTDIKTDDFESFYEFCRKNSVDTIFVGPEVYLCSGIYDFMKKRGINVFGPSFDAAKLEGSKSYAKRFMEKYSIPTASYKEFENVQVLKDYLTNCKYPVVLKADGLAAGKGVAICDNENQALEHIQTNLAVKNSEGDSGNFIIEEFLNGKEASLLCFIDGKSIIPMIYTRDHKRAFDGDKGPNTGGMGVFSRPEISKELEEYIQKNIVEKTLKGIKEEKLEFKGVIFIGLMLTGETASVIEYNVRMGDPETQVVMPLLETDLGFIMKNTFLGNLGNIKINWSNREALCVVLASEGYPGKYEKGKKINIKKSINALTFYAGVTEKKRHIYTDGGRVMSVVGVAKTKEDARKIAYRELSKISFDGKTYRNDIGVSV